MHRKVVVYLNPPEPGRARIGGLLQMWLLGFVALGSSWLTRSAPVLPRIGLGLIGVLLILMMAGISLESRTIEIRADAQRIRKSSAFGWIEVPWERVARVKLREVIPDERTPGFFLNRTLPFPGRKVESYIFVDRKGRTMFTMGLRIPPTDGMPGCSRCAGKKRGQHWSGKQNALQFSRR